MNSKIRVRLVWRLVLCLFGHLTLLLILAIYLELSLNSVQRYTPVANAEEIQLESLDTVPALLESMDAERRVYEKSADPQVLALYTDTRQRLEANLSRLNSPLLLASPEENQRRNIIRQWLAVAGGDLATQPIPSPGLIARINAQSRLLLDQLNQLSSQVRAEVSATLITLQQQEAKEANGRVTLMWILVGSVMIFTILIQLALSQTIIGPIQMLQSAVRRLQAGDYTARAHLRSGDEVQSLGETFNAMAESIRRSQEELQEKNAALSTQQEALRDANASLEQRVSEKTEQIQKTLAEAEADRAKLQTLIERMPDGLLLLDEAGKIVLINDAALTILGHRDRNSLQEWMLHQPGAFSFRHLNQQALTDEEIPYRRVLHGETFSNVSIYSRGRDNQTRLVSFSGAPVHPPKEGRVELSLLIFRDVSQELALRQELEDKNQKLSDAARIKDEFLAMLSHEFRTPLTPVITCANLLSTDTRLDPEQLKSVRVIERNARALSRMIDELLDLSAVMNRKLLLMRERTEMNEWTRATLETMRPVWEKKGLTVLFVPASQPIELEIDPPRLAQVLTNLINNAIKFTESGGKITVRLTARKHEIRIAVTDNGAGLNRHEIDRIFEMFHQTRTRRTQSVGGLGVGLTVARSLAELHGGGLRAESPGLGKGATFTLWLPPSESAGLDFASTTLIPPVMLVDRSLLRGRRILLVEDATDTREALQRIFERRECRVRAASTGEEALEMALREPPEIVISDIGLPGLSGLELMTQLRALPEFQDVIGIALSGLGRERDIKAASDAGFDAHLLKPVEIAVLDQTLIEALQSRSVATGPA
jgi:signal transduction histidine kinase/CheY-like chemotaxis protein